MKSLYQYLQEAEQTKTAIGHFNIANLEQLKAIVAAVLEIKKEYGKELPVIVGVSEGEREFIGVKNCVSLIKNFREESRLPIFINADHTHSLEKVKEAAEADFDAILFDGGKLSFEENVKQTKEAVSIAKTLNSHIIVEGELGYIGGGSEILKSLPEGAALKPEDFTRPEDALKFVEETGVDMLAPAVGNIHGMFANASNPSLDIQRIQEIKNAVKIPLVLHGGSGTKNEDFVKAIEAGINIIHISTELRYAWRKGMEKSFAEKPEEVAPYKLMSIVVKEISEVVKNRLKLFSRFSL